MKYSEFHRLIRRSGSGWTLIRVEGSHYIYQKGSNTYAVPFHGSKEMGEGLRRKIMKKMGLS